MIALRKLREEEQYQEFLRFKRQYWWLPDPCEIPPDHMLVKANCEWRPGFNEAMTVFTEPSGMKVYRIKDTPPPGAQKPQWLLDLEAKEAQEAAQEANSTQEGFEMGPIKPSEIDF